MNPEGLRELIEDLQRQQTELDNVEVKSAQRGTPKRIYEALREANLEPPRFDDRRTSFRVTFKNHTLMTPEATEWLNHYRDVPLNDQQRKALVYLRNNRRITNSDYRRLNRVDAHTAGDELHGLAQTRLVDQHGVGRGTFYRLSQNLRSAVDSALATGSHEEKILAFLEENGSIDNSQCRSLLSVDLQKASYLLKKLRNAGALKATGSKRYRKYVAP